MLSCWHYSLLLIALTIVQLILEESIYCLLIVIQHDQTGLKFRHVLTSKNETWKIDSGKVNPENKHANYLLLSSNLQRQIFWTILQINNVIGKNYNYNINIKNDFTYIHQMTSMLSRIQFCCEWQFYLNYYQTSNNVTLFLKQIEEAKSAHYEITRP